MEANKNSQTKIRRNSHASAPSPRDATPEEQQAFPTLNRLNRALEKLRLPAIARPVSVRRSAPRISHKPARQSAQISRQAHEAAAPACCRGLLGGRENLSPTRHAEPGNFLRNPMKTITVASRYSTLKKANKLPRESFPQAINPSRLRYAPVTNETYLQPPNQQRPEGR